MEQWNKRARNAVRACRLTRSAFCSGAFRSEQGSQRADPQTDPSRHQPLKRASPSLLLSRELPWLSWWQELLLNWVASWDAVGVLTVTSATTDEYVDWDVPTDLDLARMELEELLQ